MYPKTKRVLGAASAPTLPSKDPLVITRTVGLKRELPGTVIMVHGVNDVGTAYGEVERGLCQGLCERLSRTDIRPNAYRTFNAEDRKQPIENPDAVFFRRQASADAYSPFIPFYWGSREERARVKRGQDQFHGQSLDRFGNRLDADGAKGGGPFNNATTALPDMWGPGAKKWVRGVLNVNWAKGDPLRPVLDSPPRNYFVLAAERLAMLVRMIRRYHPNETVSIVAHSQGCLISLLAQAFLAESKEERSRPADTLVLTHPPYSLIEQFVERAAVNWNGIQSARARLATLAAIVTAVSKGAQGAKPEWSTLARQGGMAGPLWSTGEARRWIDGRVSEPYAERDNRGRVYLYFCPEDVTVGLENVQGIGWQGVPETVLDKAGLDDEKARLRVSTPSQAMVQRHQMPALAPLAKAGFFQRVFTMKSRAPRPGAPIERVATGTAAGAAFVLRVGNESTTDHVAKSERTIASELPNESRTINAPALPEPYCPNLLAGTSKGGSGPMEAVDPIDAAIATTNGGIGRVTEVIDDDEPARLVPRLPPRTFPGHEGLWVKLPYEPAERERLRLRLWGDKAKPEQPGQIHEVYLQIDRPHAPRGLGKLLLVRDETAYEAQKAWLGREAPISFHGAIFGRDENHRRVSAYDVAVGQGLAVTDPCFYDYLCAVADWRMKKAVPGRWTKETDRLFDTFLEAYAKYWSVESPAHRALIERTVDYYTEGAAIDANERSTLVTAAMPRAVVSETVSEAEAHRRNGIGPRPRPTGSLG